MMTIIGEEIKKVLGTDDLDKNRAARKSGKPGVFDKTLADEANRLGGKSEIKNSADKVEISGGHKEIEVAKKAIDNSPDIRWDRVEELKKQIREGSYQVSSEQLADKMLGDPDARRMLLD